MHLRDKSKLIEPNPKALIMSMRAFGYDITTAIADIIDNSISAGAKNIEIDFNWNEEKSSIVISDDGIGMNETELVEAMRLGTKSPLEERNKGDLGRFGLGLKTASFSQCKVLTVTSKKSDELAKCKQWDLDFIVSTNEWLLLDIGEEQHNASRYYEKIQEQGTVVTWENLDRLFNWDTNNIDDLYDYFLTVTESVKKHISEVYSSYNKIKFYINGRKIEMWDPFLADNTYTRLIAEEEIYLDAEKRIVIRPYILPHHTKLSSKEFAEGAGQRGWCDLQGFYVYRNNRLIIAGDWLGIGLEKKEAYRMARIRIDIDNSMDDIWHIDVKKAKANPPESLKKDLIRIAKVARKESSNIFRHRGKEVARSANKSQSFVWKQKGKEGKILFEINRQHPLIQDMLSKQECSKELEMVLKLIESSIPIPVIVRAEAEDTGAVKSKEFSDEELKEGFQRLYGLFISMGRSEEESINEIAKIEPFIYHPEIIDLYRRA